MAKIRIVGSTKRSEEGVKPEEDDPTVEAYLLSVNSLGEPSFGKFAYRRFMRLILPWCFGTLCSVIPRQLLNDG